MSRGLGPLQLKLLSALRRHGREARLDGLAALAAGLIDDLGARVPYGRAPSRNQYTAVARAVASLRRRGLVETTVIGTRKGHIEWHHCEDGKVKPRWRPINPSKYALVRLSVDSWGPANPRAGTAAGENG